MPAKKPDPAIYLLAVETLGLDPADTLVVEDSRNGLRAAARRRAALPGDRQRLHRDEDFTEAALVVSELGDPDGAPIEVLADRGRIRRRGLSPSTTCAPACDARHPEGTQT